MDSPVLAIDPGTTHSAFVVYQDSDWPFPLQSVGILENEQLLEKFRGCFYSCYSPVIEMVASYGMPVGREVFETVRWIGRFHEGFGGAEYVFRKDVKLHLCQSTRAKDGNVRQAILDMFPPAGGGKTPQVGTKLQPGPLYGVSKDVWSAVAVALTFVERN